MNLRSGGAQACAAYTLPLLSSEISWKGSYFSKHQFSQTAGTRATFVKMNCIVNPIFQE
jgi:hypothetical protein